MSLPAHQKRLDDAFQTFIEFANLAGVRLYEKEVTPPGYTAGGPIDTTTMRNSEFRTAAPKKLKSQTQVQATVAYATEVYGQLWDQIGIVQLITITYPDQSTIKFYGWIDSFTPGAHKEGEQPTATLVVQSGMRDPDGNEAAPLYAPAPDDSSGA